jgi:hypothetical protein
MAVVTGKEGKEFEKVTMQTRDKWKKMQRLKEE